MLWFIDMEKVNSAMFENSDTDGQSVLRSKSYLTTSHMPDRPIGRDSEIQRIADSLRPLAGREVPENLLVYGPSGAGKTTCVKHVLSKLEEETRVKTVYINCWQYNTRPSLLTELLIRLGYPAPRKGKPVDELLSKLREWLDKNRGVAVALDEFDQLEQKTEIIYDLQMLNEEAANKLGVVMVSNQEPSRIHLDPRSRSRLNCRALEFEPYDTVQLVEIMQQRAEQAFRAGAVSDDALEVTAERTVEENGDCRRALDFLLSIGRKADEEGKSEVTAEMAEEG